MKPITEVATEVAPPVQQPPVDGAPHDSPGCRHARQINAARARDGVDRFEFNNNYATIATPMHMADAVV